MFYKQIVTFAALAIAGTAAFAEDITIDHSVFMSQKTRAEVHAEAVKANLAGQTRVSEVELSPTMAHQEGSTLTREKVRVELRAQPRHRVMIFNDAA